MCWPDVEKSKCLSVVVRSSISQVSGFHHYQLNLVKAYVMLDKKDEQNLPWHNPFFLEWLVSDNKLNPVGFNTVVRDVYLLPCVTEAKQATHTVFLHMSCEFVCFIPQRPCVYVLFCRGSRRWSCCVFCCVLKSCWKWICVCLGRGTLHNAVVCTAALTSWHHWHSHSFISIVLFSWSCEARIAVEIIIPINCPALVYCVCVLVPYGRLVADSVLEVHVWKGQTFIRFIWQWGEIWIHLPTFKSLIAAPALNKTVVTPSLWYNHTCGTLIYRWFWNTSGSNAFMSICHFRFSNCDVINEVLTKNPQDSREFPFQLFTGNSFW